MVLPISYSCINEPDIRESVQTNVPFKEPEDTRVWLIGHDQPFRSNLRRQCESDRSYVRTNVDGYIPASQ